MEGLSELGWPAPSLGNHTAVTTVGTHESQVFPIRSKLYKANVWEQRARDGYERLRRFISGDICRMQYLIITQKDCFLITPNNSCCLEDRLWLYFECYQPLTILNRHRGQLVWFYHIFQWCRHLLNICKLLIRPIFLWQLQHITTIPRTVTILIVNGEMVRQGHALCQTLQINQGFPHNGINCQYLATYSHIFIIFTIRNSEIYNCRASIQLCTPNTHTHTHTHT